MLQKISGWRWWCPWAVVCLSLALAAGCEQEPPPPDPETLEQEIQQLNEHRQREWNNE
jgi:hypothetical protein